MRKTIDLNVLKSEANKFFLHSNNDLVSDRKTLQIFVSNLLMSVDAYRGFNYLSKEQMPTDCYTFGIERSETGNHKFPDDSRIFFY